MAMAHLLPSLLAGGLTGLIAGAAIAWTVVHRHKTAGTPVAVEPADPFVSAEIDRAAAKWASDTGQPQAAPLLADKLHLLYALGRRKQP